MKKRYHKYKISWLKQPLNLEKRGFSGCFLYTILMAKNNLNDIKVYSQKLDELYENNDVCNIAVTGPYDSGENGILHKNIKAL